MLPILISIWNAFMPDSMMDQRVAGHGKNGDSILQKDGISRLAFIPKDQEEAQNIHWIKRNGEDLTKRKKRNSG